MRPPSSWGTISHEAPRTRHRGGQLPDRHEPGRRPDSGSGPRHHGRQLRHHAVLGRPRAGPEDRARPDRGRGAGRPVRDRVDTGDTDTGPHCMGTFASRATHRAGNAIVRAADEAKRVLLEVAADEMEASPEDLETDGEGNVRVIGSPGSTMTVQDVALAAHFKHGKTISGRGMYMKPKSEVVPETGEMDPDSTEAHACTVADVEVDTETGSCACCGWLRPTRSGARSTRRWSRARSGAAPGWGCRTRCTRRRRRTTRRSIVRRGLLDLSHAGAAGSAGDRGSGPGDALLERPIWHEGRER